MEGEEEEEECATSSSGGKSSTCTVGSERKKTDKVGGAFADGLLRVADFQVVYEHLYPVRLHWRPIGDRLGLNPSDLENYEDEYRKNDQRLRKVILEWLRQRNLRPTWKALIEALSHQTVGEEGAAHDLQEFVMPGAKPGMDKEDREKTTEEKVEEREESDKDQEKEEHRHEESRKHKRAYSKPVLSSDEEQPTVSKKMKKVYKRSRQHRSSPQSDQEMVREHSSYSEPEVQRKKHKKWLSSESEGERKTFQSLEVATSTHGEPITPDPQLGPMELFAQSLTAEYERVSAACEEKLYPTPTAEYTNLAVIRKNRASRAEADMFTRSTLHGGLDEIMREKKPVNLEDVFKPDGSRQAVNYVLVEGAPGVGKSTFALELCQRWHNIELMRRFVAVVLLRLRERRVQEAKSEADLLYHEDYDIKKDVVKQVRSSSGENVLLVLDGFDELPSCLQQSSFVANLIRGRQLRKATILVTSRPSARSSLLSLRPHPDKHVEVLGFTSILIDQYARSVYGADSQLLADFHTYIDTNPAIKSMMYVPLNSSIVVEIYQEYRTKGRPIPQTMTQLYTELTLLRIRSYLTEQCNQPLDSLPLKLEDLSKEFCDQLFNLAELAFNGCKNKEVIFERLPDGCTSLGLMTASQEMYIGTKGSVNYNFFHFTHQEFLGALYISRLTLDEKREIFLQCLDGDNPPKMSVIWKFVVGLVGFENIGWDGYVPWLGRLLCSTLPEENEGEREEDRTVTPFLAQCLYEAQEKVEWGNPLETDPEGVGSNLLDCFVIGYCVAASKWAWGLHLGAGPELVKMFVYGLKSTKGINGSIRHLDLVEIPIGVEVIAYLQELPHKVLRDISDLQISAYKLDNEGLNLLSRLVRTMTSMKLFGISHMHRPAGYRRMANILEALTTVNQLHTLYIGGINLGPVDIMALSQLIRPSVGSVKELKVSNMTLEHTEMMLEAVLGPTSLESLELNQVPLTPRVATLLKDNHNLIELTICDCTPGTLSDIAKVLHSQTTLRKLHVKYSGRQLEREYNTSKDISPSDNDTSSDEDTNKNVANDIARSDEDVARSDEDIARADEDTDENVDDDTLSDEDIARVDDDIASSDEDIDEAIIAAPSDHVTAILSEMLRKNQSLQIMTLTTDFTKHDVQPLISALQDNHTLALLHLEYLESHAPELELDQLDPRVFLSRSWL